MPIVTQPDGYSEREPDLLALARELHAQVDTLHGEMVERTLPDAGLFHLARSTAHLANQILDRLPCVPPPPSEATDHLLGEGRR